MTATDAFLPGLKSYQDYPNSCAASPSTFSGTRLNSIIDSFGPTLMKHLTDEIPSLLSLSRFGSSLPLQDMVEGIFKKSPSYMSKTGGVPFFFRNLDTQFEDGLWKNWPPIPAPAWFIMQNTIVRWNSGWWRFAGSDCRGKLRELPASQ